MTASRTITGWLFDLYPSAAGMTLWVLDGNGVPWRFQDRFVPSFFLHLTNTDALRAAALVERLPFRVELARTRRREIYSDEEWEVVEARVHDPLRLKETVRLMERHFPHFVFFNSDIPAAQLYLYSTGLFPLAFGEYTVDAEGWLAGWHVLDAIDAMEYTLPPLTVMKLANRPDFVSPKYRRTFQLEVSYDGATYSLEHERPTEVLRSLNDHLRRCDPDVIMTEYGDAVLLPALVGLAAQEEVPLLFNRDPAAGYMTTASSSYFAYGKIVHKDGAFELAGRWHLDIENSFMMGEASLDGVVEIARLTQLPVQHQSRSTIGSALSSMQLSWAVRHRYLIPARKREPEEFKPATTLLLADRGGLIFQPDLGFHEQVAEMDFVSMYPTIMVEHNVSPETVNCRCCTNARVPELRYSICERREGIVPATLRTVVRKRSAYKRIRQALKAGHNEQWRLYDRRQNALKWMLVTCFGYLGYKNARFGRIEAHESVNAYSRDAILQAKEIAEGQGYHFLHAIIDCMWIARAGATEEEYARLAAEVSARVGITISLDGIYDWILFPASKMDPRTPTANRYVGWYSNGEIKIRGIEVRRRDTPVFIKRMQGEMLKIFGAGRTLADLRALVPAALEKAGEFITQLRTGTADPMELVVHRHISREAEEYTTNNVSAVVARALDEAGVHLAPGEMIEYIITDASGKRKPEKAKPLALYALEDGYDAEKYIELALKAVETLLLPFGFDVERLTDTFGLRPPARPRALPRSLAAPGQLRLFE